MREREPFRSPPTIRRVKRAGAGVGLLLLVAVDNALFGFGEFLVARLDADLAPWVTTVIVLALIALAIWGLRDAGRLPLSRFANRNANPS